MPRIIQISFIFLLFIPVFALADGAGSWDDYDQGCATGLIDLIQQSQSVCVVMGIADADLRQSYDDDWNDDDNNNSGNCDWVEALTWLTEWCVELLDEDGNSMTQDEVIAQCDGCIGSCGEAYREENDCELAVDCLLQNCFPDDKNEHQPSWYDQDMGVSSDRFSLYRWNEAESKDLFKDKAIDNTDAKNRGIIKDKRFSVGTIRVYSDLCVPKGKTVYSLTNTSTGASDSIPITIKGLDAVCEDSQSICDAIDVTKYSQSGRIKKENDDNDSCGCDVSSSNTGFSLVVIMTLIGLFAFGLSLRE